MKKIFLISLYVIFFVFGITLFSGSNSALAVDDCTPSSNIVKSVVDATSSVLGAGGDASYSAFDTCRDIPLKDGLCDYGSQNLHFKYIAFDQNTDYYYDGRNIVCMGQAAFMFLEIAGLEIAMNAACNLGKFSVLKDIFGGNKAKTAGEILKIVGKVGLAGINIVKNAGELVIGGVSQTLLHGLFGDPFVTMPIDFGLASAIPAVAAAGYTASAVVTKNPDDIRKAAQCGLTIVGLTGVPHLTYLAGTKDFYNASTTALSSTQVCAYDWTSWSYEGESPENGGYPIKGAFRNSYKKKVVDCIEGLNDASCNLLGSHCSGSSSFCNGISKTDRSIKNKNYREYFYNGKEYTSTSIDPRISRNKGFEDNYQRYYLRGNEAGNYACGRFLYRGSVSSKCNPDLISTEDISNLGQSEACRQLYNTAYKECINNSRISICIENIFPALQSGGGLYNFCKFGAGTNLLGGFLGTSICSLGNDYYQVYESVKEKGKKICVKSYSFCPYNFNVAFGTEKEQLYCNGDYTDENCNLRDLKKIWKDGQLPTKMRAGEITESYGKIKNFCQYNAHCTYLPIESYVNTSTSFSKYMSPACKNFIGDSRNITEISIASGEGSGDNFGTLNDLNDLLTEGLADTGVDVGLFLEVARDAKIVYNREGYDSLRDIANSTNIDFYLLSISRFFIADISSYEIENILVTKNRLRGNIGTFKNNVENSNLSTSYDALGGFVAVLTSIQRTLLLSNISLDIIDIGKYRGFTAPLVQCIRESTSNMFNNTAGLSKCADKNMELNEYGLCGEDTPRSYNPMHYTVYDGNNNRDYDSAFMSGEKLPEKYNIFARIQDNVRDVIKVVAMLSIIFIGYKVLLSGDHKFLVKFGKTKNIILYLFKFSLVFYFATGTAWQDFFYSALNDAMEFSYAKVFELASGYNQTVILSEGEISSADVITDKYYIRLVEDTNMPVDTVIEEWTDDCYNCSKEFNYTDYNKLFTVPQNTSILTIRAYGASGEGLNGDYVEGEINVNAGDQILMKIGKKGSDCSSSVDGCDGVAGSNTIIKYRPINSDDFETIITVQGGGNTNGATVVSNLLSRSNIENGNRYGNGIVYLGKNKFPSMLSVAVNKRQTLEISNPSKLYKIINYKVDAPQAIVKTKYDGCMFNPDDYSLGKGYLAIFDSLDCKIAKHFSYAPTVNIPNIILFIVSALLFGPIGIFLSLFAFLFFIMMVIVTIKAVYIFIVSFMTVSILIFVSPIVIPTILFKRTKKIFDSWLSNLMGLAFQPILLMVFLAFFVSTIDKIAIGDATYLHSNSNLTAPVLNCLDENDKIITNSLVCAFHVSELSGGATIRHESKIASLFGLDLWSAKFGQISLSLLFTVFNAFIFVFIFSHMLGKITGISQAIFGGPNLGGGDFNLFNTYHKAMKNSKILALPARIGLEKLGEARDTFAGARKGGTAESKRALATESLRETGIKSSEKKPSAPPKTKKAKGVSSGTDDSSTDIEM